MVTWLVVGAYGLGLVLLVLIVLAVLVRLGALARAAARSQRQLAEAQALQLSVSRLQERLASLQLTGSPAAGNTAPAGKPGTGGQRNEVPAPST